jgi:hypothetical protein
MAGTLTASLFAMNANAAWDGGYFGGSVSWIDAAERLTSS